MAGNKLRELLREPLAHFFAIGLVFFALYASVDRGTDRNPDEVVIDGARVAGLAESFRRTWQRPPTVDELEGLIDTWIREEILYREGLALRLDQEDPVVRRRIAQKMAFLTDGLGTANPDDSELQAWLDAHADDYRIAPRYSLRQVYFDPSRHGESTRAMIEDARAALTAGNATDVGDVTMLPSSLDDVAETDIRRTFGGEFADALAGLPTAQWAGPVASGFGLHLVLVSARSPGRIPELDEVRAAVERDLMRARAEEASAAFYEALRSRYAVTFTDDARALVPDDRS